MSSQRAVKRKGEGNRLSDRQRLEIIALLKQPKSPSMRNIARQYGVDEKTIRKLKANKNIICERAQRVDQATQESTFRASSGTFPELEKRLFDWIDAGRRMTMTLPPNIICHKAKLIASALDIPEEKFKASWGWFARFRHRFGLNSTNLFGEGGEVDRNDPEIIEALQELGSVIDQYDPSCVYNMDETGLFYRLIPRYTVLLPGEDVSTVRGKKRAKDRVTLVVCSNAIGTERVPITMIGKAKEPACISGNSWPIPYMQQKNAWIDVPTFNKWFDEVFELFVRKRTGHKVLLILDNAPGHASAFERNGIRVVFFPPNVTSWKQPMDMGIIAAVKKRYKYLLIKEIISYHDSPETVKEQLSAAASRMRRGAAGVAFGKPPHLLDAANLVNIAWNEMSPQSLQNCFKKADIIARFRDIPEIESASHDLDNLVDLLQNCSILSNINDLNIREEMQKCLDDDCDQSDFCKTALVEEIEETMEKALVVDVDPENQHGENNSDGVTTEAAIDQREVIDNSLRDVVSLEIRLSELQESAFLTAEQILQAKSALFTLRRVLQSGRSAITRESMRNSRQMTLPDCLHRNI